MQTTAQKFLTEDERSRVTAAVRKAEMLTTGEIVPMIVSTSHDYPKATLVAALLFSLPAALICSHGAAAFFWLDPENIYVFSSFFLPLYLVFGSIVRRYPVLAKPFIAKEDMETEVREEATKNFFAERLHNTRDANGVLLFISVFERKVWILADYGIEDKITADTWQAIINELTTAISKNHRCDAICTSIKQIGLVLSRHFPSQKDDTDELHNLIIR